MMEQTDRCVAISEPNSPAMVAAQYRKYGDSPEVRQLARDVMRWECRPYRTLQPPALGYFVKMRPAVIVICEMLRHAMSLYRCLLSCI